MLPKIITCPACGQLQTFVYALESKVYYPVRPYCCEVMEYSDTRIWNASLDKALESVKELSCLQVCVV